MKTVIELYDREPIYNVLITGVIKPERIIYVVDYDCETEEENCTLSYLNTLNPPVSTQFYKTDTNNIDSILKALAEITSEYSDCVLDVTGGEDLVLLAAGMFCAKHNIPALYYNKKTNKYMNVFQSDHIISDGEITGFKISDFIRLAGGMMAGHGHFNVNSSGITDKEEDIICDRALRFQKHWKALVLGLQQSKNTLNELTASIPLYIAGSKAQSGILYDFSEQGLISGLDFGTSRISFQYKNPSVKKIMTDTGLWLELYTFREAKKQGYFSDLSMSVLIDWDGDEEHDVAKFYSGPENIKNRPVIFHNTMNEIDVILVKGISPLFISCKAGNYNTKEIKSEISIIHTIAKRFGGRNAKPVLVTTTDLSKVDPYLYKRCIDMKVYVLEGEDLRSGKLGRKIVEISENKYKFREIL